VKEAKKKRILKAFGTNLKKCRHEKKMTQFDLAVESDVSLSFISKAEQGISNVSLVQLHKIADALEIEVVDLVK